MTEADKVHVVVGASGGTGSALVRELVRRGRRVRAVNRSGQIAVPPGVEVMAADATDAQRMREVCLGAGVVYNAVNVPFVQWRESFPAAVDGVLAGARAADARMVFVDDTWMYGRVSGPMTEDLPYRPVSHKGVLRAWLAERVLAAHTSGQVRTVIGRAPELYGPAVESVLGSNLFGPAVGKGRRCGSARWISPWAPCSSTTSPPGSRTWVSTRKLPARPGTSPHRSRRQPGGFSTCCPLRRRDHSGC